jgi:hypothetical protein
MALKGVEDILVRRSFSVKPWLPSSNIHGVAALGVESWKLALRFSRMSFPGRPMPTGSNSMEVMSKSLSRQVVLGTSRWHCSSCYIRSCPHSVLCFDLDAAVVLHYGLKGLELQSTCRVFSRDTVSRLNPRWFKIDINTRVMFSMHN